MTMSSNNYPRICPDCNQYVAYDRGHSTDCSFQNHPMTPGPKLNQIASNPFGWRTDNSGSSGTDGGDIDPEDADGPVAECKECGRREVVNKPGYSGGKVVKRCKGCKVTTIFEGVDS